MPRKEPRNYKEEYKEYHGTSTQKKNRAARNTARSTMAKEGRVSKGDGKEECPECEGECTKECTRCDGDGEVTCPDCEGEGSGLCEHCTGLIKRL